MSFYNVCHPFILLNIQVVKELYSCSIRSNQIEFHIRSNVEYNSKDQYEVKVHWNYQLYSFYIDERNYNCKCLRLQSKYIHCNRRKLWKSPHNLSFCHLAKRIYTCIAISYYDLIAFLSTTNLVCYMLYRSLMRNAAWWYNDWNRWSLN